MIKILLLAVVPFMTQHRNVVPKTEVSTNFYGSVTGIVDKAYIEARVGAGGGGIDTNTVDILANSAVVTNALTVATTNRVALLETANNNLSFSVSDLESSVSGLQSSVYDLQSSKLSKSDVVAPSGDSRDGQAADAKVVRAELDSILRIADEAARDANTALYDIGETKDALDNVRITAEDALWAAERLETNKADKSDISSTNTTFSNAVLAVGLNIDTNSVAVLNEIAETFGGFPIGETATTVGGLLAALAAAAAWLKKNKVGSFDSVGGATATVDNGVAKLDDFFTNSNSLLTGTIDEEVISKGTAPDAHLEAPTDEHLKLILADNSVAYDSEKALPYKLTSVIGDRVIATMTLTAASTDITLPTIAANDTTVKDFILDVTNAYAVEGVATDAGINIPRTDFKLVTRDGESLTDVTTVKAGKSAFLCFTQKSPVVVDGTTYPCWCVIQLPFGDPS